jgi:homoserine/homoserine lactone efflux protein
MTLKTWAFFCVTEFFLCLSPGPSALLVISLGLTRGRAAGVQATLGVLAANAIYFALSATGLFAAHHVSSEAFLVIKLLGAAYLIWVGIRMIVRSFETSRQEVISPDPISRRRSFWQGFVTQGAKPNLLIYFTAILPQFIDPRARLGSQVAVLAFSSFAIEFTVLSAYSFLSHRAGLTVAPRFRYLVERVGGGFLIGAGAGLATLRRQ